MKKIIHLLLKKFGLKVENRKKMFQHRQDYLSKYPVTNYSQLFLDSYPYILKLEESCHEIYFEDDVAGILVTLNNFKFHIETKEEFFILCEIYVDKDYNFLCNEEYSVIDIGCNIGLATLFFSAIPTVKKIFAFEPVLETYTLAQRNFELNFENQSKINAFNFGLGKSNRMETFMFDSAIKGNTGSRGTKSLSYKSSASKLEVNVQIKDVSEIFTDIFENNQFDNFVVKMDCEGAEYEIIARLQETGLLSKIKVLMIEWHDEGATTLERILTDTNFIVFSRNLAVNSGMLYAYNKK